jgi:hypothetical protein
MCLEKVTSKKDSTRTGIGWKVFSHNLTGQFVNISTPRPVGEWLDEKDFRTILDLRKRVIKADDRITYPIGWHIWVTKPEASLDKTVRKVRYRKVIAEGFQSGRFVNGKLRKVIIAKEIFICKEI